MATNENLFDRLRELYAGAANAADAKRAAWIIMKTEGELRREFFELLDQTNRSD